MKNCNLRQKRLASLTGAALSILLMAQAPAALAWFQPGQATTDPNFEIDRPSANAMDQATSGSSYAGDDWETIYRCTHAPAGSPDGYNASTCTGLGGLNANFVTSTGIIRDLAPASIYTTGGSKDILDITQWKWKDGSVPDKDDIEHAYAAAYGVTDADGQQLILYIGADRYSNSGDAMMGAWFFQDVVEAKGDGTFSGQHWNGDIFWTGEFTGGGVVAGLNVYVWNDPALPNYRPDLESKRIKGSKLCLISTTTTGEGPGYFASVNNKDEQSPWAYTPKQGTPGSFPYNSFMEGGINITRMLGGNTPCYSSFLIESRSSSEVNAQLKDFVLGRLDTCKISVAKECTASTLAADKESIDHTYEVSVTNTGYGTITSVDLKDDVGTPADTSDDRTHTYNGNITAGQTVLVDSYTINNKLNPPTNWVTATGHVGAYATAPVKDDAICPAVPLNPKISASKSCTTKVVVDDHGTPGTSDDRVVLKVDFSGQVCNDDTQTKLINVTATDNKAGPLTLGKTTLQPGECTSFTSPLYYYPGTVVGDGTPNLQSYSDTVTVTGKEPLSQQTVTGYATANCNLCPTCQ